MKKIMFNDRYGLTGSVLSGVKTMTRRKMTITPYLKNELGDFVSVIPDDVFVGSDGRAYFKWENKCYTVPKENQPSYRVGEEVAVAQSYNSIHNEYINDLNNPIYEPYAKADGELLSNAGFGNKMFVRPDLMPHCIIIRKVDAQRIQDISDGDCIREGIQIDTKNVPGQYGFRDCLKNIPLLFNTPREAFASLIGKVGKKSDWDDNDWYYVYTYELLH